MERGNTIPRNQNAPRARTAAALAGETPGVRPQQAPGGRTAAADAGRAPGVQTTLPHTANAAPQEEATTADGMDWMPPEQRMTPRHVPGATNGKRIAIQSEPEPTTLGGGDLGPNPSTPQ